MDPKGFDGLKKRLTGSQVLDAATNGLGPVTAGAALPSGAVIFSVRFSVTSSAAIAQRFSRRPAGVKPI